MSYTTSTRLSKELLINNTHGCNRRHTRMVGKGRTYFVEVNISPRSLDAWSFQMLSGTRGPINPVHSRHNVFICQSVLTPGGGNDIPLLKSAAIVIARSSNALCGSPLVLKLIPAVCIIAFAAWGLGPLMRLSRIIFLHESEDSWKKSNTHCVVTSYVQPLLLWIGATHICSVVDPVILPSEASQAVKQRLLKFVRLSSFTLAFAYCLSSLIQQAQKFFTDTNDTDNARNMGFSLAGKAIYAAVWVAAVALFMELLGFPTQKWLTAGGFGTVLLTLAGREIFTNFLSSIMIQAARPFALNEWIQTKIEGYEVSGTVEKVGWWSPTVIRGDDREANHIPNHKFTVSVVRNLSQKTHWRIKTHLAISHLDASKINNIVADMRKVLAKNPQIEQQRLHRRVFLDNINLESQALMILVSCFVKTSHFEEYLCVKEAVLMDLLRVVSHHRARLATPIRTIHKLYSEPDLENVPFADTIFTRPRATVNRPLLLIEPSYKINGDDKVKASTRLTHTSDGKDENVEAASPSDPKADVKPRSNPTPDSKEDKNMTTSTSNSNKNSRASATLTSDTPPPVPNSSEGLHPDGNAGYGLKETVRLNAEGLTSEGATAGKGFPINLESGGGRSDSPSATSQSKQDAVARPPLEENIVLGVALDGSKRTLPIEDEVSPSPSSIESKELTSSRNGIGTSVGKDKKDGQTPTVPKTPQND